MNRYATWISIASSVSRLFIHPPPPPLPAKYSFAVEKKLGKVNEKYIYRESTIYDFENFREFEFLGTGKGSGEKPSRESEMRKMEMLSFQSQGIVVRLRRDRSERLSISDDAKRARNFLRAETIIYRWETDRTSLYPSHFFSLTPLSLGSSSESSESKRRKMRSSFARLGQDTRAQATI